jgi:hypothetical protein
MLGFSVIGQVASIIENAMNPTCASNVVSLFCRTAFRECKQARDFWFPSLLCRSECEKHWEIWKSCLDVIAADADAFRNFEAQMVKVIDSGATGASVLFGIGTVFVYWSA